VWDLETGQGGATLAGHAGCVTVCAVTPDGRRVEHENIDVTVRGPSGIPASAKEFEKFDLVLMSNVPAHLIGAGQMQALDAKEQPTSTWSW
jgi:hypothetical protein